MSVLRFFVVILLVANLVLFSQGQGWLGQNGGESDRLRTQISPDKIRIVEPRPEGGNVSKVALAAPAIPAAIRAATATTPPTTATAAATPVATAPAPVTTPTATPAAAPVPPPVPAAAADAKATQPAPAKAPAAAPTPAPAPDAAKTPPAAKQPQVCRSIPALKDDLARKGNDIARSQPGIKVALSEPSDSPKAWWVHVPAAAERKDAEARANEIRSMGVKELYIRNEAGPERNAISLGLYKNEKSARDFLAQLKSQGVNDAVITPRVPPDTKRTLTLTGNAGAVEAAISKMASGLGGNLRTTTCPAP